MGRIATREELIAEGVAFASRLAAHCFFALPVRWIDTWLDGEPDVPMTALEEIDEFSALEDFEH